MSETCETCKWWEPQSNPLYPNNVTWTGWGICQKASHNQDGTTTAMVEDAGLCRDLPWLETHKSHFCSMFQREDQGE